VLLRLETRGRPPVLRPNNATDLWAVKKSQHPQSMVHLTEKPVELAAGGGRCSTSSRPGENILDLFGGSGSTLIAAEQTGRSGVFVMELDGCTCDVIRPALGNKYTGKKGPAAMA